MSSVFMKPTGSLIKGNVLDVSVKPFERALKDYDSQLYVVWNPKKLRNWGCWELRRRPEKKVITETFDCGGYSIARLEYKESDFIHHVLDAAYLNYDILNKLKKIDMWTNKDHFIHNLEGGEAERQQAIKDKARAELKYALRYNRKMLREMMDLVNSGANPAEILTSIKWTY